MFTLFIMFIVLMVLSVCLLSWAYIFLMIGKLLNVVSPQWQERLKKWAEDKKAKRALQKMESRLESPKKYETFKLYRKAK